MQHLSELQTLIAEAASRSGNEASLAKALGVPQQHISAWKTGKRSCVPEDQAVMAAIAGYDPVETLARAMVYKHEGTPRGDRLMRALGKALLVTGAAAGSAGASAAAIFSSTSTGGHAIEWAVGLLSTMYIMYSQVAGRALKYL